MIPSFPNFKKLELSDKASIEAYTNKYLPYSAFNFTNLWAWDTRCTRMVSDLNGNLVVLLTDYKTSEPFLSFLGTNKSKETAHQLIQFADTSGFSPRLRFITEESARDLKGSELHIEEDRGNSDYIFSIEKIANSRGKKFKERRHLARRFLREYPDATFEIKDINDKLVQEQMVSVLNRWEAKKKSDRKTVDMEHERKAISRLLKNSNGQLILSCVYLHDIMLAFGIDEILPNKYAISHFVKGDIWFKGIYEFLNERIAEYLLAHDVVLWNWQQDLNLQGIKEVKMSYQPVNFLKRFSVSTNSALLENNVQAQNLQVSSASK